MLKDPPIGGDYIPRDHYWYSADRAAAGEPAYYSSKSGTWVIEMPEYKWATAMPKDENGNESEEELAKVLAQWGITYGEPSGL